MAGAAIGGYAYGGGGYSESYSEPVAMEYSSGGGGSYEGGETIIVNGTSEPTAQYAQQAETIADNYGQLSQEVTPPPAPSATGAAPSAAEQQAFTEDWKPLGVYAITDDTTTAEPTKYVQLVVSKSGAVGGELHDLTADTSTPLTGAVDPKSQRVAWKVGTSDTVMETGLYNLTQTETPVLIHDGTQKTRQITMARIQDPNLAAQPAGATQPAGVAPAGAAQPAGKL